ncbi:DNA polymerase Y family protein [Microbacterium sp. zg.B48]|uniref:DNA polymerase Y family protein n=1 Tax=unclassified Microbacterium TaxID=2609290 RepID=UPI00214CD16F|nr:MULTISPECIES: DNA polymerase Y family protein [unclassified Microbacterium]MCR2762502.1 DNA polymerase Y family protein [Microbacterium sp. zg.B48]MCR2810672.1 DNA polymerase Y family protein [Microbacterium sp. zg.B185]WIM18209.1 DNA polymerase Y family protein [Microbacterium sp. zg-B185]
MRADAPVRSLVLWFPDWPVTALTRDGSLPEPLDAALPIAVMEHNAVVACSASARAEGVRRGQRRRDAQARCPRLTVVTADPVRDHRVFAPIVAGIEERAPGVQIVRPGLCALRARGPARYYGGESEAARVLLSALRDLGLEGTRAGIADGPFTAEQAARIGATAADPVFLVPSGGAAGFLAPLPIASLEDPEMAGLLARLGVRTLGDFAAMEADRVRERFGERGIRLHELAAGRDSRAVEPRVPPPELHREVVFEPPLEIAEQVAFGMRMAADAFIAGLGALDLVCTELRVELAGDRGERSERVWLHPGSFDAASVVDRVRWQLGEAAGEIGSGVARVRIEPAAVDAVSHHAPAIFGAGTDERVHHALSRVQAMLGHRGVLTPAIGGGRWLAERQVLVPWGDRVVLAKERARPWPGSLPDPLPGTVFATPLPVEVSAETGATVGVDERGRVTDAPAMLVESGRRRGIEAWAGPWPVIERSWDAARSRRAHRFQVVDADQTAWLLVCENDRWTAEARYD